MISRHHLCLRLHFPSETAYLVSILLALLLHVFSIFRFYIKLLFHSPPFCFYPCTCFRSPISTVNYSSSLHLLCSYPFTHFPSSVYTANCSSFSTFLVLSFLVFAVFIFHSTALLIAICLVCFSILHLATSIFQNWLDASPHILVRHCSYPHGGDQCRTSL